MHSATDELFQYSGGAIGRSAHPELATRFDRALRRGEIVMLVGKPEWVVDTVRRAVALHDGR